MQPGRQMLQRIGRPAAGADQAVELLHAADGAVQLGRLLLGALAQHVPPAGHLTARLVDAHRAAADLAHQRRQPRAHRLERSPHLGHLVGTFDADRPGQVAGRHRADRRAHLAERLHEAAVEADRQIERQQHAGQIERQQTGQMHALGLGPLHEPLVQPAPGLLLELSEQLQHLGGLALEGQHLGLDRLAVKDPANRAGQVPQALTCGRGTRQHAGPRPLERLQPRHHRAGGPLQIIGQRQHHRGLARHHVALQQLDAARAGQRRRLQPGRQPLDRKIGQQRGGRIGIEEHAGALAAQPGQLAQASGPRTMLGQHLGPLFRQTPLGQRLQTLALGRPDILEPQRLRHLGAARLDMLERPGDLAPHAIARTDHFRRLGAGHLQAQGAVQLHQHRHVAQIAGQRGTGAGPVGRGQRPQSVAQRQAQHQQQRRQQQQRHQHHLARQRQPAHQAHAGLQQPAASDLFHPAPSHL